MRRAVISRTSKSLELVSGVIPEVPEEGALLKTLYAGVCHSDLHFIKDEYVLSDGTIFRLKDVLGDGFYNITLGHEISGEIVEFGSKVNPAKYNLDVGDNVCVLAFIGCQKCETCLIGLNNICDHNKYGTTELGQNVAGNGGYSTHVIVPDIRFAIKVPDTIPMSVACLLPCSGLTAYAALLKATTSLKQAIQARGHANLLLIGAGGLGHWAIQLVKRGMFQKNEVKVIVADINEEKTKAALDAGADKGLIWEADADSLDLVQKTLQSDEEKVDAAINFFGNAKTSDVALKCLNKSGTLVMIGIVGGTLKLDLLTLVGTSTTITGNRVGTIAQLNDLVKLMAEQGQEYPNLKEFTLDEVNLALDELKAGKITGRAIIKFD